MIVMLDEIVEKTKLRIDEEKKIKSLDDLKAEVLSKEIEMDFPFKKALSEPDISIIAEVKRASPSKGLIAEDFDYVKIAKEYEEAGASAISVLTEPYFFLGSDDYLSDIAQNVSIPILRKDFVIDEYMIWQASEISTAMIVGAEIVGVNNRNLNDFTVDIENSINLRRCVSGDVVFISESGIKTKEDVTRLKENNVDAVLIGETLMKSDDKKSMISELKNG